MNSLRRRDFLSLAALASAGAGLAECANAQAGAPPLLRSATYIPPSYKDLYPGIERFRAVAERQSNGTLSYEAFHSGTLLGAGQLVPGLLLKAADAIFLTSSYVTSSFPILGATQMPFVTTSYARQRAAMDPDGPLVKLINDRLSAKNVRMLDGMMSYLGTVYARDLQQILRYGTAAHFGAYTVDTYCRKDWYDSRSANVRDALDAAGRAIYRRGTANMLTVHEQEYLPAIKAGGVEIFEPTETESAVFRAAVQPVYEHWRSMIDDDALTSTVLDLVKEA